MCPVAAESKNSKPSSKKKINKKINTNLETVVEEDSNKNNQTLQTSAELNESNIENNNNEFSDSEEDKGLGNIKLGPKGIYTEDSIRVYLQEIGRIRLRILRFCCDWTHNGLLSKVNLTRQNFN